MIKKIKHYALTAMTVLTLAFPVLVPATAMARTGGDFGCRNNEIASGLAEGASRATSESGETVNCRETGVGNDSIGRAARGVVNIFSIIVGAIAVIMIIYGGFRYITSGGDSGRVGNAKNTLIYAIVGLIIVALAQLIVHFILSQTQNVITE